MNYLPKIMVRAAYTITPKTREDMKEILTQARDNKACIKIVGGVFPYVYRKKDIIVSLRKMNKIIHLDMEEQRVTVEPGITLQELVSFLQKKTFTLEMSGKVPDVTVADAIATGVHAGNNLISNCLVGCEILTASGEVVNSTWEENPGYLQNICCGLGMPGIILSATFKVSLLYRVYDVTYCCPLQDVLEHLSVHLQSSYYLQIQWMPLLDMVLISHTRPVKLQSAFCQPLLKTAAERLLTWLALTLQSITTVITSVFPGFVKSSAHFQFWLMRRAAAYRTGYCHQLQEFQVPADACFGARWIVPSQQVPMVLYEVSVWVRKHPWVCASPVLIQSLHTEQLPEKEIPHLSPFRNIPSCSIWIKWFRSEMANVDVRDLAELENVFHEASGRRCWSAGPRVVSPLLLNQTFSRYRDWCTHRSSMDPTGILCSGYVEGTLFPQ